MAVFYEVLNAGVDSGVQMSNVMHLAIGSGTPMSTTVLAAALEQIRVFYDFQKNMLATTTSWTPGVRVLQRTLETPTAAPAIMAVSPAAPVTGAGGVRTASQLAICVSWRTDGAGRSYRGRTFMGVLAAARIVGGVLEPGLAVNSAIAGNNLISGLQGLSTPVQLRVYSRKLASIFPITSAACNVQIDTLRSRAS